MIETQRWQNKDLSIAFEAWYYATSEGVWKEVAASKRKRATVQQKLKVLWEMLGRVATSEERQSHLAHAENLKIALQEADFSIAHMEESRQRQEEKQAAEEAQDELARVASANAPLILNVFEHRAENKRRLPFASVHSEYLLSTAVERGISEITCFWH